MSTKYNSDISNSNIGVLIRRIVKSMRDKAKPELNAIDIDIKHYFGMLSLLQEDGINQREFGKKLDFPEYLTSRYIDSLVDLGFVERRPDPNSRRAFLVYLTKEGRAKAELLPEIRRRIHGELFGHLTKAEYQQLKKLLQKVVD